MKSFLTRPVRFLVAICVGVLLLVSYVTPAFATPMKNEPNPSANKAAQEYEQAGREPLEAGYPGPNLEDSIQKTKGGGLNEVQGKAGLEEMKRPSNSGGVPTIEERIEDVLEGAANKAESVVK